MVNVGYYNGEFGLIEEMKVPFTDRALYFGDGVYDATYAVNHHIFALDDHMDRFYNSCKLLEIPFAMPREELAAILQEVVDRIDCDGEIMLYWQASRGSGLRNHVFPDSKPNLLAYTREFPMKDLNKKFKAITMEDTRFLHCNIKTLNLIPSVIANQRAKEAGCDETIFHRGDMVTECAHSNVTIIKDGVFRTHPTNHLILPGITRNHLIQICREKNIPVEETPFTLTELMNADEVIITSSGALCNAVDEIDGKPVGGKAPEILKTLQDAYRDKFKKATKQI